jgi:crotonobetainyl-CoA:carnitine CoA-transferase CaiB-like acyl-CoA transferase
MDIFRGSSVIHGRVQTPAEVVDDPQALANNFFSEVDFSAKGKIKLVNTPVKFHQDPSSIRTVAPEVGQHTEDILLEMGYTWDDLSRLKDDHIIL